MKNLLLLIGLLSPAALGAAGDKLISNQNPGADITVNVTTATGSSVEVTRFSPPLGNGVRSVGTVGSAPQLATYSALVAADFPGAASLSYFWSLNADGNDGSANAKHLSTTVGSPSFTGVGFYGNESIVTFKTGDALRRLSDTVFNLNLATATVTYGGWAFLPSTCFGSGSVLLEQSSVIGTIMQCSSAGFRVCNTSGSICVITNGYSGLADSWHHYVLSINAGTLRLYVDGQLSGSNTGLTGTGSGADFRVGDPVLQGRMQQVFYTAQVLTESQINVLYSKRFKGGQPQIAAGHTLAASSFPLTSLTNKVNFWNLSGLTDGSGNAKTLTNNGTVPFTGLGLTGAADAATFDGSTQRLTSADAVFNPGDISFAYGGWFNADNWTPASSQLMGNAGGSHTWRIWADTNGVYPYFGTGAPSPLSMAQKFVNGTWHHLASTYNRSRGIWSFYVDGSLVGTFANTNTAAGGTFNIGANGAGQYFKGRIRDAFFAQNVEFTDADIRKLYSAKVTHNKAITPEQQYWQASWLREDGKMSIPLENGWITDVGTNDLFMDFSDLNPSDQVFIRSK